MLVAARSSSDLACCVRATASARSKGASTFTTSGFGDLSAISPAAMDLGLAAQLIGLFHRRHRFADTLPGIIVVTEFGMALAKYERYSGIQRDAPVDRHESPNVIIWIASGHLPIKANTQPLSIVPPDFRDMALFSSAVTTSASRRAFAAW
jgi:hypothetical protein